MFPHAIKHHLLPTLALALVSSSAFATEFHAEVDRTNIAQDESVTLKIIVETEGSVPMEAPNYTAPLFDQIQDYQSNYVESVYVNGQVTAKFTRTFHYFLRPKTTGKLSISGISIAVDGQKLTAPPITVVVGGGGGGTQPPSGYGGGGSGLRGAAKPKRGTPVFARAEVDKNKVVKGEQIIISYYLYLQVTQFNAQVEKYPELRGFFKEELEMPIRQGRLQQEVVTLDGQAYKRVLVSRYVAYPIQEGKLTIDPIEAKVNYMESTRHRPQNDEDDPSAMVDDLFAQFFDRAIPRTAQVRSDLITVQVEALPTAGKTDSFSGVVGNFSVISAADRYDLKEHEALTLTLKVEGKGNLSTLETPKIKLPEGVELYDSRSQTRGKGEVGERVFEYVLIPRKTGEYTLPSIEVQYYDPEKRAYVKKSSDPITIRVSPGDPSQAAKIPAQAMNRGHDLPVPENSGSKLFGLRGQEQAALAGDTWKKAKKWVGLLLIVGTLFGFLQFVLPRILAWQKSRSEGLGKRKKGMMQRQRWKTFATQSGSINIQQLLSIYEEIEDELFAVLDRSLGIASRGLSREELREVLVGTKKIPEDLWNEIRELFEYVETVQYAGRAGGIQPSRMRNDLGKRIQQFEKIESTLSRYRAAGADEIKSEDSPS